MALRLNWVSKNTNNQYLSFYNVNLDHSYFDNLRGVYIIWYQEGRRAITVYAGKATSSRIKDRLKAHRNNTKISAYAKKTLYVAVARASISDIDGIEKSLHDTLKPLVGNRSRHTPAIQVYLPSVSLSWY